MLNAGLQRNEVVNFIAIKPFYLSSQLRFYMNVMEDLKLLDIHLVIILTITSEDSGLVLPSSASNRNCLPLTNETSIEQAVNLISRVSQPPFNFTVTLSMRMDFFEDVSIAALGRNSLVQTTCSSHRGLRYAEQCEAQLYRHDPTGSMIVYIGSDGCAFAKAGAATNAVVSFDTPRTIAYKMTRAYNMLGLAQTATHIMGWSVYNFSVGLGPPACNGGRDRINEILRVLSAN
ncbi:hypothetical protein V5799_018976 [Amblyomma americanum]|uniref:Uncharacterized protein n=1 Tax=Amblyomma americanum TaxID=6943 RepID=A0AAQ4EZ22_AMBAM